MTERPSPIARLYERAPLGMRFGLEPMRAACARAGHPERRLAAVHVAGTNGKGSVSAMVERAARAQGLRTGLYTSPHLGRFTERIRVDGEPIADEALDGHLERALELGPELSFFETATLAAFLALADANVDLAVLEVGLGGRLDATNVIETARACAVTRIALDHTALLGSTLEEIAREKAAIAKPGVDLVVGPATPTVRAAIEDEARSRGGRVVHVEDDAECVAFFSHPRKLGLAGAYQRDNAMVAFALARRAGIATEHVATGLAEVRWPGRLERLETARGPLLLDAAHNPDGAQALATYLASEDPARTVLLFGALADKAWTEMLDALAPRAATRVYVAPKGRAATPPEDLAARHVGDVAASVIDGYERAVRLAGPDGLVVACGSIFLVGEVRAHVLGTKRDPPIAL